MDGFFLSQCICLFSCSHNAHTQLLLLATVLVFHSLTAFVSSLPQVQTSHAALGHLCIHNVIRLFSVCRLLEGRGLQSRPHPPH